MKQNRSSLTYYLNWLFTGLTLGLLFLLYHGELKILIPSSSSSQVTSIVSFSSAIAKAAPAVVSIKMKKTSSGPRTEQHLLQRLLSKGPSRAKHSVNTTTASGVIINGKEGYILTNYHVIAHKNSISVHLNDGRVAPGILIGSDPDTDLAVLKINLKNLPTIKIGNSDSLKVGDVVLAIGDPFAIGQTVTQGIISATGRTRVTRNTYENFLQTDAAINPGNSGGALINTRGEIIGINSNIYTNTGNYQGISFAIPIHMALHVFNQIVTHGYVIRGWLGVEGQQITPQILRSTNINATHGILLTEVDPDGPGDKAGLKPSDIITKVNGTKVFTTKDIMDQIAAGKPGDTFKIEGLRKRQSFAVSAILGQRPLMSR